ncbi:DNA-directed DNA polymerase [Tanacetum coccineum]
MNYARENVGASNLRERGKENFTSVRENERSRHIGNIWQYNGKQLRTNYIGVKRNSAVSFMFFNFPDNWSMGKLWMVFKRYQTVFDMFMVKRRLRNGNEEPREAGDRMENIDRFMESKAREGTEKKMDNGDNHRYAEVVKGRKRNNSLSELRFKVHELLRVIDNASISNYKFKGVTTRGGKTTTQDVQNDNTNMHIEEPLVEKDLGSFTIPCDIGHLHIDNALADLGASISLMPYTMYKKLGLGEPNPTRMSLKLADRSIQYPRRIVENVLIKVDKFALPINFVILDMPEDSRVPIILERPFLATARAMIDVFNKKTTLRVGDDEVIFDVDQSIKRPPNKDDECYGIDDVDDMINIETLELLANDKSDSFLVKGLEKLINQSDVKCCESLGNTSNGDSDLEKPIRHIDSLNTPYPVAQETAKPNGVESEHLYSASANEIDEKKLELKSLPHHLEYAYLHGDKSSPIIISSELS